MKFVKKGRKNLFSISASIWRKVWTTIAFFVRLIFIAAFYMAAILAVMR